MKTIVCNRAVVISSFQLIFACGLLLDLKILISREIRKKQRKTTSIFTGGSIFSPQIKVHSDESLKHAEQLTDQE